MALDLNDSSTWEASTLDTPEGAIRYWVLADWNAYHEQYEDVNNLTRVLIAVAWHDAATFKSYALGFAERVGTSTYFQRYTPLQNPFQDNQYLTSLKKAKIHAGVNINTAPPPPPPPAPPTPFALRGAPSFHIPSAINDNWPTFRDDDTGMPARIIYEAVFTCPTYEIVEQSEFELFVPRELRRFVTRTAQITPRERKVPSFGFETYDPANPATIDGALVVPIPEVGFVSDYYIDHYYTWRKVPLEHVPWTAIGKCLNKINNDRFDYQFRNPGFWGQFLKGTLLFKGLSNRVEPYRGPSGEWLVDLPYVLSFYPGASPTSEDTWKTIPRNDGTYSPIRVRGTNPPQPLYRSEDLETLFQPEP